MGRASAVSSCTLLIAASPSTDNSSESLPPEPRSLAGSNGSCAAMLGYDTGVGASALFLIGHDRHQG